jgi:hypothetical protein
MFLQIKKSYFFIWRELRFYKNQLHFIFQICQRVLLRHCIGGWLCKDSISAMVINRVQLMLKVSPVGTIYCRTILIRSNTFN